MRNIRLEDVAQNVNHLSFDIYLSHVDGNLDDSFAGNLLRDYLANLAVEGVLCSKGSPPDPAEALQIVRGASALPVHVTAVRSRGIIREFDFACRSLEVAAGPKLNGHAPTFYAACRIAQYYGNELSTVMTHGGLNILVLNDMLQEEKARGGAERSPPRQKEAGLMAKEIKGAKKPPKGNLRDALSNAEMALFEAEIEAVEREEAQGLVRKMTYDEALEAIYMSRKLG